MKKMYPLVISANEEILKIAPDNATARLQILIRTLFWGKIDSDEKIINRYHEIKSKWTNEGLLTKESLDILHEAEDIK